MKYLNLIQWPYIFLFSLPLLTHQYCHLWQIGNSYDWEHQHCVSLKMPPREQISLTLCEIFFYIYVAIHKELNFGAVLLAFANHSYLWEFFHLSSTKDSINSIPWSILIPNITFTLFIIIANSFQVHLLD